MSSEPLDSSAEEGSPSHHELDAQLLRRFEPVLRFTKGECFFPMPVGPFARSSSMWVKRPGMAAERILPRGEVTLDRLAEPRTAPFGSVHYLKYVADLPPARSAQQAVRLRRRIRKAFQAGPGRLARVGYVSRFVDAIFTLGLLARGRVPGGAAAEAATHYECTPAAHRKMYYGRVLRRDGWVVLQYWFFYAYNNWRSGFFGANDHEGDWEMISIFLSTDERGEMVPEWTAYASHDFDGDDLRRHWHDPELERLGDHPVVYVAAGSHASYYRPGDYLTEIELPLFRPLSRIARGLQSVWHDVLGQYRVRDELGDARAVGPSSDPEARRPVGHLFRVPFVDYARGDGRAVGPDQDVRWEAPGLLDPSPAWASDYRGLWGLYAEDPLAGEDAPAGPRFDRDGSVRLAWRDPIGWAGLHKVVPTVDRAERIRRQRAEVRRRIRAVGDRIADVGERTEALGIEADAMRGHPHLAAAFRAHRARIATLGDELIELEEQLAQERSLLEALEAAGPSDRADTPSEADPAIRAHIRRPMLPAPETELRLDRWAEAWAAISIGLAMITFVAVWFFLPAYRVVGLIGAVSLFVFIEAGFRGRLTRLVTSVTLGLAVISSLVLLYEFFWETVIAVILITGGYIMWENLRELWV